MRRFFWLTLAVAWLVLWAPAGAVGTLTVTSRVYGAQANSRFIEYTAAWTSTAGGAVSANAFAIRAGRLVSIRFTPGTGGTQPTDLYDVTLVETNGVADLTAGQGANLSNAAAVVVQWDPLLFQDGSRTVDVVVANAGASKTGTVVILVQIG